MLLEVVLALSIFIVAVVGLLQCLNAALGADRRQQITTSTRQNLQSLLDEALAGPLKSEKTEVPEDVFHVRYRREIKEERVKAPNGKELPGIVKISVVAMDTQREDKVIGELWTYASR
jgi:hypothetical protein